ncbi:hypothetical protein MYX84_10115 [Acidobacteria bacterium AH-259-O06]|nr:hypothetical protein [Acidobacteria bacterium AH-259-O06]
MGEPGDYSNPALSPDDKQVAVCLRDPQTRTRDIWLFDLIRGTASRFTFDPADDVNPVWSQDGSRIVFTSNRKGVRDIYQKMADGTGEDEILLESNEPKAVEDWSLEGRFILYSMHTPKTEGDLWGLPLFGDREPIPLLRQAFSEGEAQVSPDGRWIAYTSDESGRNEVYVQSFPEPAGKWQISTAGGSQARWRRDGKELFYTAGQRIMAVEVKTDSARFEVGFSKALFETRLREHFHRNRFVVTADGRRFLVNRLVEEAASAPITVVLNWTAEVKQ